MHDAIVVGARCAGAPLAMLLARKGHRVLLLDKAFFPSDRISTHFIMQAGLARAKYWGLLEKTCALGAPPLRRGRMDAGDCEFSGCPPPIDGIDYALAPRRTRLDKLLVDEAVSAGVHQMSDAKCVLQRVKESRTPCKNPLASPFPHFLMKANPVCNSFHLCSLTVNWVPLI